LGFLKNCENQIFDDVFEVAAILVD